MMMLEAAASPNYGAPGASTTTPPPDGRVCVADGCCADLSNEPRYCQLRRVCSTHIRADQLTCDGVLGRFCNQCGKVEPLSSFDAGKRSCRVQLARRRATSGTAGRRQPLTRRESSRNTSFSSGSQRQAASGSLGAPDAAAFPGLSAAADAAAVQEQHALLLMLQQKQTLLQRQLELLRMKQAAEAELMRLQQLHSAPLPALQAPGGGGCGNSVTAPLCAPVGLTTGASAPALAAAAHSATLPSAHTATPAPAPPAGLLRLSSIFCDSTNGDSDDTMADAAADQLALNLLAQSTAATSRCNSSSSSTLAWHMHAAAAAPWAPDSAGLPPLAGAGSISGQHAQQRMDVDGMECAVNIGGDLVDDEFVDMLEMALLQAGAAALSSSQGTPPAQLQ